MNSFYQKTAKVGLVKACLRYIEDPNRNILLRIILAFSPLLIVWVISPFDILPELILGPLGLADDTVILITLFLLMRLAMTFYGEKRYKKPTTKLNDKNIIDL